MSEIVQLPGSPPPSGSSIIAPAIPEGADLTGVTVAEAGAPIVTGARELNFTGATVTKTGDTTATIAVGGGSGAAPSVLGPWNGSLTPGDTNVALNWVNFGSGWVATRAGVINGISVSHDGDPVSAGTANFHATINGAPTTVACVLETGADTPHADGAAVAFVAGDVIGIEETTSGDFSGDGTDVAANLTVTLDATA